MINSAIRFHGHGSLRYLFKNGDTVRSRFFTIKYSKNKRRKKPRFTVIVSKKVHKSAVGRNRMRRRIYEIIRVDCQQMRENHDIAIIITNGEVLAMEYSDLRSSILELLQQAEIQ